MILHLVKDSSDAIIGIDISTVDFGLGDGTAEIRFSSGVTAFPFQEPDKLQIFDAFNNVAQNAGPDGEAIFLRILNSNRTLYVSPTYEGSHVAGLNSYQIFINTTENGG